MDPKVELLAWTALSLACGTVGASLFTRSAAAGSGVLREVLRFAWMVMIPFLALIRGASGRDVMALGPDVAQADTLLGFTAEDWIVGIGVTITASAAAIAVLWLSGQSLPGARNRARPIGLRALRDAPYNEVHWTFYRAAPIVWLGDALLGVLFGCGLVLLEWFANPRFSEQLASLEGRQHLAVRLACLFTSGLLYLATRNLWLMIAADAAVQLAGSRALAARPVRAAAPTRR